MARHLCSNRSTPRCEDQLLVLPDPAEPPIEVGSPAWQAWLAAPEHTLFYFADGRAGCTVRCELRRSKRYWYAYARHAGKLHKAYLGRAANLTHERLRTMAHRFLDAQMLTEAGRTGVLPPAPPPRHASTEAELLTTKINLPPLRARMLIRSRLIAHLDAALDTTLTLIAAPAGYGKTSLLVKWLHQIADCRLQIADVDQPNLQSTFGNMQFRRVAWLALDQADNDPARFWRYLLAALGRAQRSLITEARVLLRSASPIEAVLTCLLNRLAATPALSLVLALDDFHLIEAQAIHAGIAFLLDHAPPNLHVVLALRELPPQPPARRRAGGQLIELRTTDLRFTQPELAAYLSQVMDLNLSDGDMAALDRSTEGWITGIQLAALSHQRAPGSLSMPEVHGQRAVLDYLAAEVFAGLAPEMQAFLLDTAVLERFCAPLCDALRDVAPTTPVSHQSLSLLEQLERSNLFLVPLDAQHHWYRYHHLFAGFLRERLAHTAPQQVALLHGRAARWFKQQRLRSEAATHALAANDPVLAGRLVCMAAEDLVRQGEVLTLGGWIEALPHALVRQSAELSLWYAWVLALTLRQDQVAPWLAQVEYLSSAEATGSEHAARLGQVAVVRATVCAGMGDLAGTIQHAQTALTGLPDRDAVLRAVVALNLGTAQAAAGNLTAAAVALTEALALSHASAHHYIYAGAAYVLGRLRVTQGRLYEAARSCRQAHSQLAAADQQLAAARVSIALSTVLCEWNELAEAERLLGACMALIGQSGYAAVHLLGCLTQARIHWARGRVEQALVWLDQAECAAQLRQNMPDLHLVAAWRVRIGLSQGHLAAAEQWLAETGMALDAAPERERAAEYAVAAEVALARARAAGSAPPSAVVARLAQLHQQALADTRHADALTAGALLALVYQARGDLPAAQAALRATLALGAPEGAIRTLAELGAPLAAIIQSGLPRQAQSSYVQRLLNACLSQPSDDQSRALLRWEAGTEPLSAREREVLGLLGAGLADAEIARRLGIAVGTARWHTKNILAKLGVPNRTQAAIHAHQIGLC